MRRKKVVLGLLCTALACSGVVTVAHFARLGPSAVTIGSDPLPVVPTDAPETGSSPNDVQSPAPRSSEPSSPQIRPSASPDPYGPDTEYPTISADGTVVAWISDEAMVEDDTNGVRDVFVRDRRTHTTERVSVSSSGAQANGASGMPALSADSTHIVFVSAASNLVPNDTNDAIDVFVRDLSRGTTIRVSVASDGAQGNGDSGRFEPPLYRTIPPFELRPSISGDGQRVAFDSQANDLVDGDDNGEPDVFVRDILTGTTTLVSSTPAGTSGAGTSLGGFISEDGRRVGFESDARDLLAGAVKTTGPSDVQVFVRDLADGTTQQASVDDKGDALQGSSFGPTLDRTGHIVAFGTGAWKGDFALLVRNLDDGTSTATWTRGCECLGISVSADASTVVWFGSYDGGIDPFVYGVDAPHPLAGVDPQVSPDGRYVVFHSGVDPTTLDYQQYGGDFGAMVFDRSTKEFTAAYRW